MSESEIEIRVVIDSGTGTKFLQRNTFIVKEYQRGYRWEPAQVVALLEDIYEFDTQNNVLRYCLQPLVVKKCAPLNDGNRLSKKLSCQTYATGEEDTVWELIDGQQRLTTVLLILVTCYEGKSNKLPYDIVYANNRSEIDDYYIDRAKETIREWFKRFDELRADDVRYELQRKIHSYIQFIWYQVPDGAKSNEIFTKLNMGKIPLTNAELFKALLLSSDGAQCNNNSGESQRDKIAVEWDFVEQSLHDDNFWYFISNEDSPLETRIDYLLKLFALTNVNNSAVQGKKLIKSDRLFSFLVVSAIIDQAKGNGKNNNENIQIAQVKAAEIWEELVRIHDTLHSWYENNLYYHKIGFLIAITSNPFDVIQPLIAEAQTKSKSEILKSIDSKIKDVFKGVDLDKLNYNKSGDRKYIRKVLLFFNIYTMINSHTSNRFSFHEYKNPTLVCSGNATSSSVGNKKKSRGWDVEHIHARAEDEELINATPDIQKEILSELKEQFLFVGYNDGVDKIDKLMTQCPTGIKPDEFIKEYNKLCDRCGQFNENGLGNLALLDAETNRSYKNALFAVKRKTIIERDKGAVFIPVCTKNVFLKMYSDEVGLKNMQRWDTVDAECYLDEIKRVLIKEARVCQTEVK